MKRREYWSVVLVEGESQPRLLRTRWQRLKFAREMRRTDQEYTEVAGIMLADAIRDHRKKLLDIGGPR